MKYLETQGQFEVLIGKQNTHDPVPRTTVIWFSAEWCGPCKKIRIQELMDNFNVNWLKCDIDRNDYTAGYCNIRSIPTFMVIHDKKIVSTKGSSNTSEVYEWLKDIFSKIDA